MVGYTNISETKLAITGKLNLESSQHKVINKINEIIGKINFLDEHINFLYERSRTQHHTLIAQSKSLQNVYDEFQEFKKRFETYENHKYKLKEIPSHRPELDLIEHQENN